MSNQITQPQNYLNKTDNFTPFEHLIAIQKEDTYAPYLPVAARIAWFWTVHPNGRIDSEVLCSPNENVAVIKASVYFDLNATTPSAVGTGTAVWTDDAIGKDFRAVAETRAIGKALNNAGFGTPLGTMITEDMPTPQESSISLEEVTPVDVPVKTSDIILPAAPAKNKAVEIAEEREAVDIPKQSAPTTYEEALEIVIPYGNFKGQKLQVYLTKPNPIGYLRSVINNTTPESAANIAATIIMEQLNNK